MRITVLILGLMLVVGMFLQAVLASMLLQASGDKANAGAVGAGIFVALLWLLACALVLPIPLVSTILFVLAGLLAFAIAGTSIYKDMWFWGGVAMFLAMLSFLGWRGKVKDRHQKAMERTRQDERDARYEALLNQQQRTQQPHLTAGITCHACGATNPIGTRFCGNCGANLAANQSQTA